MAGLCARINQQRPRQHITTYTQPQAPPHHTPSTLKRCRHTNCTNFKHVTRTRPIVHLWAKHINKNSDESVSLKITDRPDASSVGKRPMDYRSNPQIETHSISLCIFLGPRFGDFIVFLPVVSVQFGNGRNEWTLRVWIGQKRLDGQQQLGHFDGRRPVIL